MSKTKVTGLVLFILLIVLIGSRAVMPYILPVKSGTVWSNNPVSEREKILYDFVQNDLTDSKGGIKTNYVDEMSVGDITKGNAVLSESEGMMLLYYLNKNDKDNFEKTLDYINYNLVLENNLISWRLEDNKKSESSATIDDLRIVKALLLADERFGDFKYRKEAIKISNAIYKDLVIDDVLIDFNETHGKSKKSTLCYLDLPTLRYLNNIDSKWKYIYNKAQKLVNDGLISENVPLYRKYYDTETGSYDSENADTLLSCIVILNKAENNEDVSNSVKWLKEKFRKDGGIYASYNSKTGERASDVESTSIYALLVKIGVAIDDNELYNLALQKLKAYQVLDKKSPLYGGYGDTNTLTVYSFDNLNALLAYREEK